MKNEFFIIVAYDVISDKRRNRIAKILKDYNGCRVNDSVFECRLREKEYKEMRQSLEGLIEKDDSVLIYEICAACEQKVHYLGLCRRRDNRGNVLML